MALSVNALTTVAALSLDASVTTTDKEQAIERASDMIRFEANRDFISQSHSDVYRGNNTQRLILKHYPVTSVTSLSIDGTDVTVSDLRILDGGILEYENGWFTDTGYHDINVTYVAGYILTPGDGEVRTLPYDLEWACIRLAERTYEAGYTRLPAESYGIPPDVQTVIDRYKRVISV